MTQKEFNELSKRYLGGKTTEEDEKPILAWFNAQPEFKKTDHPSEESLKSKKKVWSNLRKDVYGSASVRIIRMFWVLGAAICGLLGYIGVLKLDLSSPAQKQPKPQMAIAHRGIELKNNTYSDQKITLADGSLVELKPGSSLIYNKDFNLNKRELYLDGEAFFKVTKNPSKPFIVHAGKLVAEVIGTSFSIKNAKDSKNVEVDVLTGKVSVYAQKMTQASSDTVQKKIGVVLTPNQRVQYLKSEHRLVKSIVEIPNVIISKEELKKMTFFNAPIAQVFEAIEKAYGLVIIYDEEVMQDCTITTSLDDESLNDKLMIICKVLNVSYEMVDAQIIVSSNGCQ
jgi:ferric-dicitrate binding protein FerR (iron transport regulator)